MQTCPRCSAENRDDVASCWNCAAPLEGAEAGGGGAVAEEITARRSIPLKPIVIVLVIAALAFGAYRVLGAPKPAQVASQYLDSQYNGRASLAAKVISAETATAPLLPPLLLVGPYTVDLTQQPTISGGTAQVAAQASFRLSTESITKDPKLASAAVQAYDQLKRQMPTQVILVKRAGEWKVDQAATSQQIKQDAARYFRNDKAWIAELFTGKPLTATPSVAAAPKPAAAPTPGAIPAPGAMAAPGH